MQSDTSSAAPILSTEALHKHYGGVHAVRGIDLRIRAGECYGLLGPNGAGKTTSIEMMEGIVDPSSGQVLYEGEPLGARFRAEAGIQFQHTALQDFLTVREQLQLFRRLYAKTADVDELIALCALGELQDRDARKLSGGQRQRLLLAIGLINAPRLVFLDEPTTGLDPQARRNFWQLVRIIRSRGTTVILTTHYMEEASQLCDRIGIMDHGKVVAEGTPGQLLDKHFSDRVLRLPDLQPDALPDGLDGHATDDGAVEILTNDLESTLDRLRAAGVSLARLQVRDHTLEDLFLHLTGEALRG